MDRSGDDKTLAGMSEAGDLAVAAGAPLRDGEPARAGLQNATAWTFSFRPRRTDRSSPIATSQIRIEPSQLLEASSPPSPERERARTDSEWPARRFISAPDAKSHCLMIESQLPVNRD